MSSRTKPNRASVPVEAEVTVDGVGSQGGGVARLPDGRAVFVHRTVPGDRARIRVTHSGRRWARGQVIEILSPGPDRRAAPCPYYFACGGCTLQELNYPAQLAAKGEIVTEALRRIGKRDDVPPPRLHAAPTEYRYRNRVTFTLRRFSGGRVSAGFHRIDTPERILDIDDRCLLPESPVIEAWGALRRGWGPGADLLPGGKELRLTLRGSARGEVILLISGGEGGGEADALLARVPELTAIWALGADSGAPARLLAGDSRFEEDWLGDRFDLHPTAFLQVYRAMAETLHARVLAGLGALHGVRVLDAYCGIGSYGRWAARSGAVVVGIEADPGAVRVAEERPEDGFTVLEGRVEDRLDEALPAEVVLLNPPRAGVETEVMERIAASGPDRILYASCDPATLARDLSRLGDGYRIDGLEVFDLFPQTSHLESVLTLRRE